MNTDKKNWRKELRKFILGLLTGLSIYVGIYLLNSFFGGYWLIPERDGRDKYTFGLSITDAILWQPRFGHESLGHWDYIGAAFQPAIKLDRKLFHPTLYFLDENFDHRVTNLPASQIHPYWHEEFLKKVAVEGILNQKDGTITCKIHYEGSTHPREIFAIRVRKDFVNAAELSPPEGFIAKPFDGHDDFKNKYDVRWIGKIELKPNKDLLVTIPAKNPKAATNQPNYYCSFWYQRTDDTNEDFINFSSIKFQ